MKSLFFCSLLLWSSIAGAETINCEASREDGVKVRLEIENYESASISYIHPTYGSVSRQGFAKDLLRETDGSTVYYVTELKPHTRLLSFPNGTSGHHVEGVLLRESLTMACTVNGDLAEEIKKPAPISCGKKDYKKILFEGIEQGKARDVEEALTCGAKANEKTEVGCTALLFATDLRCGTYLPQKILGDSNGRWTYGAQTPGLQNPVSPALEDVLNLLTSKGALLDARDPKNGETPLIKLVRNSGDSDLIASFLQNEPEIDAQDLEGNTALMWATTLSTISAEAYSAIVELTSANASRTIKNSNGQTAYDAAKGQGLDEKNRGFSREYDKRILRLLKPASKSFTIVGKNGECSPLDIMFNKGESVEFRLEASDKMYLMTAPGLSINLMAMGGETVRQVVSATQTGNFEFSCGFHGAEKQSKGRIMVH